MESVDRDRMTRVLYPQLLSLGREGVLDRAALDRVVAASVEGYAFPTNLDRDPPLGGLAAESPQVVVRRALQEGWSPDQLSAWMDISANRRMP
jgi:hypothetical protein